MSGVILASFSRLEMDALLPLARQAFGRSIAAPADKAGYDPPLHHMLCIAAIKDPNVKGTASSVTPYLDLFHAGFFIAAHEDDFAEILEIAAMPAISGDTVSRGVRAAFIAGTLTQWRQAILRGCIDKVSPEARTVFNSVYKLLCRMGLSPALQLQPGQEREDRTFLIEHKK